MNFFRIFDRKNKKFININSFKDDMLCFGLASYPRGDHKILIFPSHSGLEMSFGTGLKDKNGKEIYEGDILNVTSCKEPVVVKWTEGSIGSSDETAGFFIDNGLFGMEVIGNIWENPELLNKKET